MLAEFTLKLGLTHTFGYMIHHLTGSQITLQRTIVGYFTVSLTLAIDHQQITGALTAVAQSALGRENTQSTIGFADVFGTGIGDCGNKRRFRSEMI